MIDNINLLDLTKKYSYADYLQWTFQDRLELFKGKIFKMSPAPSSNHQRVSRRVVRAFLDLFNDDGCQVYFAPFDVRLIGKKTMKKADKDIYTVVQPDVCIICDKNKIDEKGCIGAPDLIVEILSPGNTKKEMNEKYDLYEDAGVREYWLVDPVNCVVFVYVLKNNVFVGLKPFATSNVKSEIFPNLIVPIEGLFE